MSFAIRRCWTVDIHHYSDWSVGDSSGVIVGKDYAMSYSAHTRMNRPVFRDSGKTVTQFARRFRKIGFHPILTRVFDARKSPPPAEFEFRAEGCRPTD
jgi:hypothetical protein